MLSTPTTALGRDGCKVPRCPGVEPGATIPRGAAPNGADVIPPGRSHASSRSGGARRCYRSPWHPAPSSGSSGVLGGWSLSRLHCSTSCDSHFFVRYFVLSPRRHQSWFEAIRVAVGFSTRIGSRGTLCCALIGLLLPAVHARRSSGGQLADDGPLGFPSRGLSTEVVPLRLPSPAPSPGAVTDVFGLRLDARGARGSGRQLELAARRGGRVAEPVCSESLCSERWRNRGSLGGSPSLVQAQCSTWCDTHVR